MSTTHYPSVTVVGGEAELIHGQTGPMMRMNGGSIYIHVDPEIARQWIEALTPLAAQEVK